MTLLRLFYIFQFMDEQILRCFVKIRIQMLVEVYPTTNFIKEFGTLNV